MSGQRMTGTSEDVKSGRQMTGTSEDVMSGRRMTSTSQSVMSGRRMTGTRRSPSPLAAGADAALSLGEGDVQKLIQQLPPSDDLLEYYRAKTDQFQRRLDGLTDTLDRWVASGGR